MRYLPHTEADRAEMCRAIGIASVDELFADVPASARLSEPLDLPPFASELAVERHMAALARRNLSAADAPCFLGAGAYRHHVPAAVDHLIQRSEFLTSYTPYQPEVSQGTLQYLFEFQTQVALLTGMEVANASLYDGASACAEAVLMAARVTRRHKTLLAGNLHPHYRDVVRTMTRYSHVEVAAQAPDLAGDLAAAEAAIDGETACVVVQNPDAFGNLRDLRPLAQAAQAQGALLVVVVTEVLSLGAAMSPGDMGADIVVAEGQSLGNPLGFGGPYLGLFATRERFVRQMPGRLCGETVDADGRRGYVLTLSTREQHIRREKATSNICTNSGLCSLAFTIHLSLLGEVGLRNLAGLNLARAAAAADALVALDGVELLTPTYFNEFAVRLPKPADKVVEALADFGLLGGVPAARLWPDVPGLADVLLVAATETVSETDIAALAGGLKEVLG